MSTVASETTAATNGLSLPHLIRAEWIKVRSVRSTWWTLSIAVILMLLFAWLLSANIDDIVRQINIDANVLGQHQAEAALQATSLTLRAGIEMAVVVLAVFGALIVTGEYSTGMIRSTFLADPGRIGALTAKAIIVAAMALLTAIVGMAASYLIATPGLSNANLLAGLDDVDLLRSMLGGAAYLVAVALMSFALGFILRRAAGAIATAIGLILILPGVLFGINVSWINPVIPYLPSYAGGQMADVSGDLDAFGSITLLSPGVGALVMLAWVVALTTIAAVLVRSRDA